MSPLSEQLRRATAEELRRVMRTPFAERLAQGTLDRSGYVRWLGCRWLEALTPPRGAFGA